MTGEIALHRVDPNRGVFRLYAMVAARTLFGEPCLTIAWGRIGHKLRRRTELCPSDTAQVRRWNHLLVTRRNHGAHFFAEGIPVGILGRS